MSLRNYLKGIADALRDNGAYGEQEDGKINAQDFSGKIYEVAAVKHTAGMAEGYTDGYNNGAFDVSPQETVSGEAIGIKDISPIEHNMGVSVRGKNLLSVGLVRGNFTTSGLNNVNKSVVSSYGFYLKVGTYTVSGVDSNYRLYVNGMSAIDKKADYQEALSIKRTFTIPTDGLYNIQFNRTDGIEFDTTEIENLKLLVELGTTATSYAPYIEDISTVKLLKQGKNLLNEKAVAPISVNAEGVKRYGWDLGVLPQGTYTLTVFGNYVNAKSISYKLITDGVYSEYINLDENIKTKTITLNGSQGLIVYLYQGVTDLYDNVTLQLEYGTKTEYEPYIEPVIYDVPADGIVEGVKSLYPSTTLYTDTSGAVIDCTYYQDGKKVKENLTDIILELGGVINE